MVNYAVFRISENTFWAFYLNRCCLFGEGGRAVWLASWRWRKDHFVLSLQHIPPIPRPSLLLSAGHAAPRQGRHYCGMAAVNHPRMEGGVSRSTIPSRQAHRSASLPE